MVKDELDQETYDDHVEPRAPLICWRCVLFASAPLIGMIGFIWFATTQIDAASAGGRYTAASEELTDLENENTRLHTDLAALRENLKVARAVAAANFEGGEEGVMAWLRSLPNNQRAALVANLNVEQDPDLLLARIGEMPPGSRARLFDRLASFEPLNIWLANLDAAALDSWWRKLPTPSGLNDGGVEQGKALEMQALRDDANFAEKQMRLALDEVDALRAELDAMGSVLQSANDRPSGRQLVATVEALGNSEKAGFFGALTRRGLLFDWFESASIEEQIAFGAAAPASMRQALGSSEGLSQNTPPEAAAGGDEAEFLTEIELLRKSLEQMKARPVTIDPPGYGPLSGEDAVQVILAQDRKIEKLHIQVSDMELRLESAESELNQLRQ